jgi:tetratricopeptide (TPR) repeat protein
MKTKHRHELKENDLAQLVVRGEMWLRQNGRFLAMAAGVLVLAIAVGYAIGLQERRTETAAEVLLAEAMVTLGTDVVPLTAETEGGLPAAATLGAAGTFASDADRLNAAVPLLAAAVDAYPDTRAGVTARYHLASSLAALGRYDEALAAFDAVIAQAGADDLYRRMATLGRADTATRAGRLDEALAAWQALAQDGDAATLPLEAVLMELGRVQQTRGDVEDARTTFTRIVDEYPTSPYSLEAQRALDQLQD